MADVENEVNEQAMMFDLAAKKKKKKKTTTKTEEEPTTKEEENKEETLKDEAKEPTNDNDAMFDLSAKKKKKKKKVDDGTEEVTEKAEKEEIKEGEESNEFADSLKEKKKKKKKVVEKTVETPQETTIQEDDGEEGEESWKKSDRDYKYSELLKRVFTLLRSKNPELSQGKRVFKLKPPQVVKDGTRKTAFVNFMDICKSLHRQPEHVLNFLFAELGTTGSIDGNDRLVIKGRFLPTGIESILRRYINEFVMCHMCRSLDTTLTRDANTRLYLLQCASCGATRTVQTINKGFIAVVTKRKK